MTEKPALLPAERTESVHASDGNATALPACRSLAELSSGAWQGGEWRPHACSYSPLFQPSGAARLRECLGRRRVGFYGDSTLRNIASLVVQRALGPELGPGAAAKFESWAPGPQYRCGGVTWPWPGASGGAEMWWTPSAYFQHPADVGSMHTDDLSVVSIAAWDVGTYYKGQRAWFKSMSALLEAAATKRLAAGKTLHVMHVHRFWSSRCTVKHDTEEGRHNTEICRTSNSLERNLQFRAALAAAVSCVRAKGLPVVVVDTFPVTDTAFAESESDGVHFEATTTAMEAELLLQAACNGLAAAPLLPSDKCLPPEAFS